MNRSAQPDMHPDADSLNAFVEQALPGAEREQIVAHLSACGRCREVVFLAQEAAAQELQPEAIPVPVVPRPGWWSKWRAPWGKVWIPAAACAALAGGVVVWVQLRPAPAAVNMARSLPMESLPAPSGPATAKVAAPPPPPHPSAQRPSTKASAPARPRSARTEQAVALSALTGEENSVLDGAQVGGTAPQTAPRPTAGLASLSGLAATTWRPQASGSAQGASSLTPGAQPMPATPRQIHGAALAKAASPWQTAAAAPAPPRPQSFTAQPLNGVMALRMTRHPLLPSGLRTVSTAAVLDRLLAIDSAGALYLSHDAGKHWETVNSQWSGKAVEVIAEPEATVPSDTMGDIQAAPGTAPGKTPSVASPAPAGGAATAAAGSIAAKPDTPLLEEKTAAPAALFKLVNDRHQSWVSADGKVWREP